MIKPSMRINFVLPPAEKISGGPLAILEYANRLAERGHQITITTYPDSYWPGTNPFPWFKFNGEVFYLRSRKTESWLLRFFLKAKELFPDITAPIWIKKLYRRSRTNGGGGESSTPHLIHQLPFDLLKNEPPIWAGLIAAMPECDLNIATLWSTAFPVYFSRKGRPVYFMQHYEEIFYTMEPDQMLHKLMARLSYNLPIYKIANSSWLQKIIYDRHGQHVPFSNNGIEISDFSPGPKLSERDGIIRVVTFSRPDQWKGFADAMATMQKIIERNGAKIEWHVFGYNHPSLPANNKFAAYRYHPKLTFKELANLYSSSDIALCPSWYESFPLPPLEAMASGTAVVTTAYGTEDYAFHDHNALVVGSRDIDAMVSCVERLIEDKTLRDRLADAGRKTAEQFSWSTAVENREKLLIEIFEEKIKYDVAKSAKSNLVDSHRVDFEVAPSMGLPQRGLFVEEGMIFLLNDGCKHHVVSQSVLQKIEELNIKYISLNELEMARVPRGSSIVDIINLPSIG